MLASPRARGWLVVGAALALAVVLAVALRPGGTGPSAAPSVTTAGVLGAAGAGNAAGDAADRAPGSPAAAVDSLERVQRSIDDGVAAGQIRPDVGQDLDNLVGNLRAALGAGQQGDLGRRVEELQGKLQQRLGERGAITPARAGAVSAALRELAQSLPSP